jgi:hypothetical protein
VLSNEAIALPAVALSAQRLQVGRIVGTAKGQRYYVIDLEECRIAFAVAVDAPIAISSEHPDPCMEVDRASNDRHSHDDSADLGGG